MPWKKVVVPVRLVLSFGRDYPPPFWSAETLCTPRYERRFGPDDRSLLGTTIHHNPHQTVASTGVVATQCTCYSIS